MIFEILKNAIEKSCSDVHISSDGISLRLNSELEPLVLQNDISNNDIIRFLSKILGSRFSTCEAELKELGDYDFSFCFSDRRIRGNVSMYNNGYVIALRILSDRIETIENLKLPPLPLHKISTMKSGLILITGTTGSGKSTTLAAVIEEINQNRAENIVTIEDPIEYVYTNKKSRIVQKEVGTNVRSFDEAVISLMRQDPDVILLGEIRDKETIRAALMLAETGHLVFATLHCKSVFEAVERVTGVFQPEEQEQIRIQFSDVVKTIIKQQLVKSSFGGVVPINEILMIDETFSSMLKAHKNINSMRDRLRSNTENGNIHTVDNIRWHIEQGHIKLQDISDNIEQSDAELLQIIERG